MTTGGLGFLTTPHMSHGFFHGLVRVAIKELCPLRAML